MLQFVRCPFFDSMMMFPSHHEVGIILLFQILQISGWRISADSVGSDLNTSVGNWSFSGALLFFSVIIAFIISGISVFISKSVSASEISASSVGSDIFSTLSK